MKSTLLKVFCAIAVIALVTAVIITEDNYAERLAAEDANAKTNEKIKVVQDEQSSVMQKRLAAEEEKKRELATYTLRIDSLKTNEFTNKVDGYRILVPKSMEVDMSISGVRASLENKEQRIEIYRQKIEKTTGSGIISYVRYSNRFIENKIDHKREIEDTIHVDGREMYVLQWSRKPLERIPNDKCYYASVEIPLNKEEVITFLFKSSVPFENMDYLKVVRTFEEREKTEAPFTKKKKIIDNRTWDQRTAETFEAYFGEDSKLQWGIFETKAPLDFTDLKEIESRVDFRFPVILYYTGFIEDAGQHPRLAAALKNAGEEGRLVELTLQTLEPENSKRNMVYEVLDGKYDTYLKNYAKDVAESDYPVLFRLGNEMNGDWCVYSSYHTAKDTEIYKAFYRYIYQIFQKEGADNVIWVWNPNGKSFPDFKWNDELCYYPGDEYVDVVGMTSYNTGTYYEGETWLEFDHMYDALYEKYINVYEKPLMITEFSSSSVGGDKEAWVDNMFRHITKYDRIKIAIWWDGCDWDAKGNIARPYFIDETEELIEVFKRNLAQFKAR
ncbi:glycoside hydrolase family 26 protein [Sinanaerobacter chloroacetimidivorans]|jgi:mannan endo-1,4-beta-mannosidase|uniref:Endoglucanase n=1 Tax=Sinanaerobacter chloroacetimidivorans TaxID=2818044 RepID=A0A8J7W334_9FIRM|nr:glycosyl hydrolase [Sinanaerobacter chloroacetimidivorans]MBR0599997.1 endoglucanase [Sinanaerobacter chloroacetimidivorans]